MLRIEVIMANTERTRSIALQSLAAAAWGSPSTQSNPVSIQQLVFKCSSEAGLPRPSPIFVFFADRPLVVHCCWVKASLQKMSSNQRWHLQQNLIHRAKDRTLLVTDHKS